MPLLDEHLEAWLGAWPPPTASPPRISVVAAGVRTVPGWDGQVRPVLGVVRADGAGVIGVQPGMPVGEVASVAGVAALLGEAVWDAAFRWCSDPVPAASSPDTGEWVPPEDERVPEWLKPFNGDVLVVFDAEGRYAAGVGRKCHDAFGHELSVGTEPAAQGRGLARALVATAARRVLAEGAVPTYLHDFRNVASAKVAEAAGFPDRGWRVVGTSTASG